MRGPLLALLLVAPLLSGCLYLQPPGSVEPLEVAVAAPHRLAMPEVRSATGAQGFWVPDGTARLVLDWNQTRGDAEAADDGKASRVHEDLPRGVLSHFEDLLIVLGPNDTRLHIGTPSLRLHTDPSAAADNTTGRATPRSVFLDLRDPAPGLYTLVTLGHLPLPQVTLHDAAFDQIPPLTPLPVTVTRTTLVAKDGPLAGPLDATGAYAPAPRTVAVWGAVHGVGATARLDILDPDGTPVARTTRTAYADPPTAGIGTFGFGLTPFFDDWASDPAALRDAPLTWSATGLGTGIAYAYAAVVGDLPPPAARMDGGDAEAVPLEGRLDPWHAGGFVLPTDARVLVHHAGTTDRRDHSAFRIYDANGQRLHSGTTAGSGTPLTLPPGPVAIINDGPGELQVSILGTAPSDATLHPLQTTYKSFTAPLGTPAGGPAETSLRAAFDGPLLGAYTRDLGTLEDVYIQIHREADDVPLFSLPDLAEAPPNVVFCCPGLFLGGSYWPSSSVDPGVHRLRMRSEGGQGDLTVEVEMVDLAGLLGLDA